MAWFVILIWQLWQQWNWQAWNICLWTVKRGLLWIKIEFSILFIFMCHRQHSVQNLAIRIKLYCGYSLYFHPLFIIFLWHSTSITVFCFNFIQNMVIYIAYPGLHFFSCFSGTNLIYSNLLYLVDMNELLGSQYKC